MTRKNVEKAYNKLSVYAKKRSVLQGKFDAECREQYGFTYNEIDFLIDPNRPERLLQDESPIIDTLDYGNDCLPFNDFDEMMKKAKKIVDAQERVSKSTSSD